MLAMGRHQPRVFEHQHHPYFRAAAGEFWLPAGASWQVRPACQSMCWGWNGEQIWHAGENAAQYGPMQQHTCTCSAELWPFSCCWMSNPDVSGQWFRDQTGRSNLVPGAQWKPQHRPRNEQDSGQARGEHEARFQESSSTCVRLERRLLSPDQRTINKGAKIYLLWKTTGFFLLNKFQQINSNPLSTLSSRD